MPHILYRSSYPSSYSHSPHNTLTICKIFHAMNLYLIFCLSFFLFFIPHVSSLSYMHDPCCLIFVLKNSFYISVLIFLIMFWPQKSSYFFLKASFSISVLIFSHLKHPHICPRNLIFYVGYISHNILTPKILIFFLKNLIFYFGPHNPPNVFTS